MQAITEPVQQGARSVTDAWTAPADTLREGMVAWSSVDAPWLAQMDREPLGRMLGALDALQPAYVLSAHLPVADRLDTLTDIIRGAYGYVATATLTPETAAQVEPILG